MKDFAIRQTDVLYSRINFREGGKAYLPTIRGTHHAPAYKRAREAEAHSTRVRDRYNRLKAAEAQAKLEQFLSVDLSAPAAQATVPAEQGQEAQL